MIRYFAAHPTAANIVMAMIVLLGVVVLPTLNKETFPEIVNRNVQVKIAYPGASPNEVEEAICIRLEDATDGISYLEEQKCVAQDNLGVLTLLMREEGKITRFLNDVNSAVEAIHSFPSGVEKPVIQQLGRTQPVISVAISADLTRTELKALAQYYREQLLKLEPVPMVTIDGFSDQEFKVQLNSEQLGQYGLSVAHIAQLIRQQTVDMPIGTVKTDHQDYQIRLNLSRNSVAQLAQLVVLTTEQGGQVRLGDIATIEQGFQLSQMRSELNGKPAAILQISKNATDDTLKIYEAVKDFVLRENHQLPDGTRLYLTQDNASIVAERIDLLVKNGLQGVILAGLTLLLFFHWRFSLWVIVGLPVSFVGGMVVMSTLGVTINMISLVALLMAIGILMDDSIVISESISSEYEKSGNALEAVIAGVRKVARGVLSSFLTSAMLFGSLLFLDGDMGQVMGVLPQVLLAVLIISLLEAFFILPHHLTNALSRHPLGKKNVIREQFDRCFDRLRNGALAGTRWAIRYRYFVLGSVLAFTVISIALLPAGILKFKFFPQLEGNILQARVLMPQGTPFSKTEAVVSAVLDSLDRALVTLEAEPRGELVRQIQVSFGKNSDVAEQGVHLATITLDLLDAQTRVNSLHELRRAWLEKIPVIAEATSIQLKEPVIGPAGQAIAVRLRGQDFDALAHCSWQLQQWFLGYRGVTNVMDDLRPGKPQFRIEPLEGLLNSGVSVQSLGEQLRAAYQGILVNEVYLGKEAYEINVVLEEDSTRALAKLETLLIFNNQNIGIPLSAIARIRPSREFSQITRFNHERTVTVVGDIDNALANTGEILNHTRHHFLPQIEKDFPTLEISFEGEVKNSRKTNSSIGIGFVVGIIGVYLLLAFQFQNYREPFLILLNIPLALIGVIWGHVLMGLDLTMPSLIGFVSLAGVVVNDSILLLEVIKRKVQEQVEPQVAAAQAVYSRFRAVFLTSITTVAGMLPLLFETSLQAQILIPLVASVVFGIVTSTLLIIFVLPSTYVMTGDIKRSKS